MARLLIQTLPFNDQHHSIGHTGYEILNGLHTLRHRPFALLLSQHGFTISRYSHAQPISNAARRTAKDRSRGRVVNSVAPFAGGGQAVGSLVAPPS